MHLPGIGNLGSLSCRRAFYSYPLRSCLGLLPRPDPPSLRGACRKTRRLPPPTNPVKPTAASLEKAKKLYRVDCAMCHGDNGDGKTDLAKDMQLAIPDWTNPASLSGQLDRSLFDAIRNGKGKMPPEAEGRANDTEVWNLIHYIRGMSKGHAAVPVSEPAEPVKPNN